MGLLIISILCILSLVGGAPSKLPANFPRCAKKDPNINGCLKKAIQSIIPEIFHVNGLPAYGVFPLDPLVLTELNIGKNEKSSVNINLEFRNLSISGLGSMILDSVEVDVENYKLVVGAHMTAPVDARGKYEAEGRILILPIRGKGPCQLKFDAMNATMNLVGRKKIKNGLRYMEVTDLDIHFTTKKLHIHFDGLFSTLNGNNPTQGEAIGETMDRFLNENWVELLDELKPAVEQALGLTFKEAATRIFSKVPFDDIFI